MRFVHGHASQWRPTPARPRVRSPSPAPNLSLGSSSHMPLRSNGSPAHVSALSRPGTRPGIRPVIQGPRRRSRARCLAFPLPFGRRRLLLGHPFPPGNSAPLTVGLPRPQPAARTRTRFPCSARVRPGWLRGRVAPVHCCTGAPSGPRMPLIAARGPSKPPGRFRSSAAPRGFPRAGADVSPGCRWRVRGVFVCFVRRWACRGGPGSPPRSPAW